MTRKPRLPLTGTDITAPDADALADFCRRLLGWEAGTGEPAASTPPDTPSAFFSVSRARYGVAR